FRRSKATDSLPPPEPGRVEDLLSVLEFWELGEGQTTLALSWLLGALSPGPYPLMALSGEQGSGKTTLARVLQRMVDPGDVSSLPRESRDLFVAARHSHVLGFDNVSGLPGWLSDDLCKLSTGGTLRVRELYTDGDEVFFHALRPVILNGITDFVARQDLVDRAILLHLPRLERYEAEAELWDRFNRLHARALGALLDLASLALRELPRTRVPNLRMADFARWALAAEAGYAPPGTFERAFADMRHDSIRVALDSEPIYPYLPRLLEQGRVEATAAELLERLNGLRGDGKPPEGWPRTPHALGQSLKRLAPALRQVGLLAEPLPRSSVKRGWAIDKVGGANVTNVIQSAEPRQGRKNGMTFGAGGNVTQTSPGAGGNVTDDVSDDIYPEEMSLE
ncbi:MAG: DNA primase, partial [Meiothermus sp.]